MRFCLRGRQSREYVKKAQELMVEYRDNNYIYDLMEINPDLIITLEIKNDNNLELKDWEKLTQYKTICKNGFRVMVSSASNMEIAKKMNYDFFSSIPAYDMYHLNALINFGVCAARIDGHLAHQLDIIAGKEIEIRSLVNNAKGYLNYNNILTGWFRPEDLPNLPIDVCEFVAKDNRQEQALYRIYAERQTWAGPLKDIIVGIEDEEILNRMIPPEFQEHRSQCGMHCQTRETCHYCLRAINMAKTEFIRQVKSNQELNK